MDCTSLFGSQTTWGVLIANFVEWPALLRSRALRGHLATLGVPSWGCTQVHVDCVTWMLIWLKLVAHFGLLDSEACVLVGWAKLKAFPIIPYTLHIWFICMQCTEYISFTRGRRCLEQVQRGRVMAALKWTCVNLVPEFLCKSQGWGSDPSTAVTFKVLMSFCRHWSFSSVSQCIPAKPQLRCNASIELGCSTSMSMSQWSWKSGTLLSDQWHQW